MSLREIAAGYIKPDYPAGRAPLLRRARAPAGPAARASRRRPGPAAREVTVVPRPTSLETDLAVEQESQVADQGEAEAGAAVALRTAGSSTWKNSSKMNCWSSGQIPMPVSRSRRGAALRSRSRARSISALRVNFTALSSSRKRIWLILVRSVRIFGKGVELAARCATGLSPIVSWTLKIASSTSLAEVHVLDLHGAARPA